MSPKTGRPKAKNPKDIDLKVRVDENTHQKLKQYAENKNITKAQAVRNGILLLLESEEHKKE